MGAAVSVIVPTYNCARLLPRALASVFAQTVAPAEVIVIDDGSTDGTDFALARSGYRDRVVYLRKPNGGVASARNVGLRAARSEWIAFLDADDEWLPERLERGLRIVAETPDLRWCSGAFIEDTRGGGPVTRGFPAGPARAHLREDCWIDDFFAVVERHVLFHTATMLVHRRCFAEAGEFDESLRRREDLDLWVRIAFRSPRIGYSLEPLARYVRREGSLTDAVSGLDDHGRLRWLRGLAHDRDRRARCRPYGRYLAEDAFKNALYRGAASDVAAVARHHPEWLPRWAHVAARLIDAAPSAAVKGFAALLRLRQRRRLCQALGSFGC